MSTCDGAILAMGTVMSHNVMRNIGIVFPSLENLINEENLLLVARITAIPMATISTLIAIFYRSDHSAGATGYLLIVAFDIMFATCVVPLFGCFYTKKPSPLAALCSICTGILVRVILEFALPKDGFLILPFPGDDFLNTGAAASTAFPTFFDQPEEDIWDPSVDQCEQPRFNDWTGVDSLAAPLASAIVFVIIQWLERNGPIFSFKEEGVMDPYIKVNQRINEFLEYSSRNLGVDSSHLSRREILEEMSKHVDASKSFRLSTADQIKEGMGDKIDDTVKSTKSAKSDEKVEMVETEAPVKDEEPDEEFLKASGLKA